MKKNAFYICLSVAASCAVMAVVDSVLQPGYAVKSAIKIVLFLTLPLLLSAKQRLPIGKVFSPHPKALLTGGILGAATFGILLLAYSLLHSYIDLSAVPAALEKSAGVTGENFLFVGTYIALCNSLLEEFFFRCFTFLQLVQTTSKRFAYLFSAAAFSVYHAGMLIGMIGPGLFLLALAALFLCGLMFNYLSSRHCTVWVSWMLHMGANLAINTIGMHLLGML